MELFIGICMWASLAAAYAVSVWLLRRQLRFGSRTKPLTTCGSSGERNHFQRCQAPTPQHGSVGA